MRSIVIAGVLAGLGLATSAHAQRVEPIAMITGSPLSGSHMHPVGPRYIAMSELLYSNEAAVDVLDLNTQQLVVVQTKRATLLKHFGLPDPMLGQVPPAGQLVAFDGKRAGLWLSDSVLAVPRRHWYAELDAKSGLVVRFGRLANTDDKQEIHFLGTDVQANVAWFYVENYAAAYGADYRRLAGPTDLVFRRLDLKTLAYTDVLTLKLPARPMKSGYEDRVMVHHAADFSRFAVVEYDEADFKTTPATKVYFIDPINGAKFTVPAMDTTYGVGFTRDGKYAYLASNRSKLARVDLVKQKIDKYLGGPAYAHHVLVSPNGSQLFVLATGTKFTVYDLPRLTDRREVPHHATVVGAMEQLYGGGVSSLDGMYFVVPAPLPPGPTTTVGIGPPKEFVLAKLVD